MNTIPCVLTTITGALLGELRTFGEDADGYWTVYCYGMRFTSLEEHIKVFPSVGAAFMAWEQYQKDAATAWRH